MQIPNGPQSLACYAWMSKHFQMIGDSMPNMDEIHLEQIAIKDIYEEYIDKAKSAGFDALNPTNFTKFWKSFFPHGNQNYQLQGKFTRIESDESI